MVTITACGSSAGSRTGVHESGFVKYADCLRSHGVADFPDPGPSGGIQLPVGFDTAAPAFKSAQRGCAKLLPGGGPGNQHPTGQDINLARETATCMRAHGVTGFPDPIFTPPSSPAGYSIIENHGGVITAVPASINPQSPVFQRAARACGFS